MEIDQLQQAILQQLQQYSSELEEEIDKSAKKTAQDLNADLKKGEKPYKNRTGDYSKGWRLKKVGKSYVNYNKTDYQLTHLLEKGHAKRGGGRVQPKIHIAPAEERAVTEFLHKIERAIRS
ncbi:HK97 gp10 family phage protein [Bacillus sp. ISL-75]|uniref:HK97 gp10 family phage protein n=1 Tax=Bacillus sp. ISL-75 TaxID=2819137 RepID=UPI001BEBF6E7|nr:HK97 gp10 family phage protein [Bacillus sp. ISL-75]MBT2728395.1 HK97 gp10 family phage protein [Bacillus sp. ISL-75]